MGIGTRSGTGSAVLGMAAALMLAACGGGGGDGGTPGACLTRPDLSVTRFVYPDSSFLAGQNAEVLPTIETASGRSLAEIPLRFELATGPLPTGLAVEPATGRITGRVGGPSGGFPVTIRLNADCFAAPITASAFFTVN